MLAEPADENAARATQQEVVFDLPADQSAIFTVNKDWKLTLHCAPDAQALIVHQSGPAAGCAPVTVGQNR
jgi:hypothetical protein